LENERYAYCKGCISKPLAFVIEASPTMVQKLIGHENLTTTQAYLNSFEDEFKKALEALTNFRVHQTLRRQIIYK